MRNPPAAVKVPSVRQLNPSFVLAEVGLKTLTAMFGGGASPRKADPDNLVRSAAVRGQLRFWWRACNVRKFDTLKELREAESDLWGSAAKKDVSHTGPGAISLDIREVHGGGEVMPSTLPPLPVFPYRANAAQQTPEQPGIEQVTFQLRLTLAPHVPSAQRDDVLRAAKQALWAWVLFGGIGARTRRGCGALAYVDGGVRASVDDATLTDTIFDANKVGEWAAKLIERGTGLPEVPSLHGARITVGRSYDRAIVAWRKATQPLHDYRQAVNVGRGEGTPPRPGQSYWPAISAIRGHLGLPSGPHGYRRFDGDRGESFPRADFGLPIVFSQVPGSPRLDADHPRGSRMASPVILKPVQYGAHEYRPMVLVLDSPHPDHLKLQPQQGQPINLEATPFRRWPVPRKAPPETANTSYARDAFIAWISSRDQWDSPVIVL